MKTRACSLLFAAFGAMSVASFAAGLPPVPVLKSNPSIKGASEYVAETLASARRQGAVNAGGINWRCSGMRCSASGPIQAMTLAVCKALAQEIGPLKSYGSMEKRFGIAELEQCNFGISKATQTANGPPSANSPNKKQNGFAPSAKNQAGATALAMNSPPSKQGGFAPPMKSSPGDKQSSGPATPGQKQGGFAPAAKNDSGGSSPASGSEQSSKGSTSPTRAPGPVALTIDAFTVTGTGTLSVPGAFSPKSFTIEAFTVTGAAPVQTAFSPKSFTIDAFTVTGTGALP